MHFGRQNILVFLCLVFSLTACAGAHIRQGLALMPDGDRVFAWNMPPVAVAPVETLAFVRDGIVFADVPLEDTIAPFFRAQIRYALFVAD